MSLNSIPAYQSKESGELVQAFRIGTGTFTSTDRVLLTGGEHSFVALLECLDDISEFNNAEAHSEDYWNFHESHPDYLPDDIVKYTINQSFDLYKGNYTLVIRGNDVEVMDADDFNERFDKVD